MVVGVAVLGVLLVANLGNDDSSQPASDSTPSPTVATSTPVGTASPGPTSTPETTPGGLTPVAMSISDSVPLSGGLSVYYRSGAPNSDAFAPGLYRAIGNGRTPPVTNIYQSLPNRIHSIAADFERGLAFAATCDPNSCGGLNSPVDVPSDSLAHE